MAYLKFKPGALVDRTTIIAAAAINAATALSIDGDIVITEGYGGKHMVGSKHYTHDALDIRSNTLSPDLQRLWVQQVRNRLGSDYDVILEDPGKDNEHFHVEYDPRKTAPSPGSEKV